jgi:hypothetical protein
LLAALRNQSVSNNLIRSFVVIIVALGISSVLVVSVVQKQKEIGILRAMGTSSNRIMGIFLLQGALVGPRRIVNIASSLSPRYTVTRNVPLSLDSRTAPEAASRRRLRPERTPAPMPRISRPSR